MYQDGKEFIEIFNRLERFMGDVLEGRPDLTTGERSNYIPFHRKVELLVNARLIGPEYQGELRSYGQLRNAIVHQTDRYGNSEQIIANPLQRAVDRFRDLSEAIMTPPKAWERIVILKAEMAYAEKTSRVIDVIRQMKEKHFSYLPILENDRLFGVFSQDTLFFQVAEEEGFLLDEKMTISEFGPLLALANHDNERFEIMRRSSSLRSVAERFACGGDTDKRLEIIFFTENGKVEEKLLGLTTIWDLMAYRGKGEHLI